LHTWSWCLWACNDGTNARIHTKHKLSIDNFKRAKPKPLDIYTNFTQSQQNTQDYVSVTLIFLHN
jgi:hypothetical protein